MSDQHDNVIELIISHGGMLDKIPYLEMTATRSIFTVHQNK